MTPCCTTCKTNQAFFNRKYSGESLCKRCFTKSVEAKVRTTITRHHMLSFNDHLAVAVSGGKDSLTLLYILAKMSRYRPQTRLTVVTIDEGIKGYRDEALEIAVNTCNHLNLPHHIESFKELYGYTLDELIQKTRQKNLSDLTPCSYCGVLRRRAINVGARRVGANKVATGHTLDDEVQTSLMNILRGDLSRLIKESPATSNVHPLLVPKIKPLCEIPERESALYAYSTDMSFQGTPCPYASEALRNDVRGMLNRMEEKHTGTKFTVSRTMKRLRDALECISLKEGFRECILCGEPSAMELCKACEMLKNAD